METFYQWHKKSENHVSITFFYLIKFSCEKSNVQSIISNYGSEIATNSHHFFPSKSGDAFRSHSSTWRNRDFHCVKSVQIWSFSWSVFPRIRTEYRKIRTRKNSLFGHFSHSVFLYIKYIYVYWFCLIPYFFRARLWVSERFSRLKVVFKCILTILYCKLNKSTAHQDGIRWWRIA